MLPHVERGELGVGPAAVDQLGEQRRVPGDVAQPDGQPRRAVEVAADPDVLDAGHVTGVLHVVGHLG